MSNFSSVLFGFRPLFFGGEGGESALRNIDFSLLQNVRTGPRPHPSSHSVRTGELSWG
jgi:hypothetical protein